MYQGQYITINNFSGGYCGNLVPTTLKNNQAMDLDNIVIKADGQGWRRRNGTQNSNNTFFGGTVWGIGYLLQASGSDFIVVVAGDKIGSKTPSGSTFTDRTGSLTITNDATSRWDLFTFSDTTIGFGGPLATPDAPFKWTGSGNASALGGTPPTAAGGFTANNRVFAFKTSANPSTIYWSVLGNAEDWTSSGSGSATVGTLNDNQTIVTAKVLSTNNVLVFKQTSTYNMIITSSPFPVYSLFQNTGCVGKHAAVNIDGIVYWINQRCRMVSTNGEEIQEYPPNANDLFDLIPTAQYPYISGIQQKGSDYNWLVWICPTNGSNGRMAIIWDLINKCWLRCSTGYEFSVATTLNSGIVYAGCVGTLTGYVAIPDFSVSQFSDATSSISSIFAYWRSGWMNIDALEKIVQVNRFQVEMTAQSTGTITVSYGFDFTLDSANFTLSQVATGSQLYVSRYNPVSGRGNYFNFKILQSNGTTGTQINQIVLRGKVYGQKATSMP